METKTTVNQITVITSTKSMSVISKGPVKGKSLINTKLGIYQKVDAAGALVSHDGKNRPFSVFIEGMSAVQTAIGFDIKKVQAYNTFKDIETAEYFVENFADCVQDCKIHAEYSFEEFYAGQTNVMFKGKDGVLENAIDKESNKPQYRHFTFAPKSYVPRKLSDSKEINETISLPAVEAAFA